MDSTIRITINYTVVVIRSAGVLISPPNQQWSRTPMGVSPMKQPKGAKKCLVLCAIIVASGFLRNVGATPINITLDPGTFTPVTDLSKGLLGDNSPQTNFSFLLTEVDLFSRFSHS